MDWIGTVRRRLGVEPERDPARALEALLPRFDAEGRWAEAPPRLHPERVPPAERTAHVRRAIDALPELYRLTLLLCDVEGLSKEEAADALGVPLSAVSLRLHRARQALLTLLASELAPALH